MIEPLAVGTYRALMTGAAGMAAVASRLPGPRRWRALGDRLGRLGSGERALASGGTAIWLHAASVGELVAARPLYRRLRDRFPGRLYVVSTLTRTGLELARGSGEAHLSLLLPLDAPATVHQLLGHFDLEAFLFTETEIWPTLLTALGDRGVPTFMVSGRVGARTAAHAWLLRPLYRRALAGVDCCMQADEDAGRIVNLGADPRRVQVAGNLKFDGTPSEPPPDVVRLAAALDGRRVIVAGSTHEGEDEAVLEAYRRVAPGRPDLLLLLAPRHPERLPAVAGRVHAAGFPLVRYSDLAASTAGAVTLPAPAVVLLDAVGPLAHCYGLGAVAFVGGSLVPAGGHNVLEPARAGRPVLVGPHTSHAGEMVERLIAGGGGLRISSAESLAWALAGLLDEPERMIEMGRRARALAESGQGAVERHLKIIAARLSMARFARATA